MEACNANYLQDAGSIILCTKAKGHVDDAEPDVHYDAVSNIRWYV